MIFPSERDFALLLFRLFLPLSSAPGKASRFVPLITTALVTSIPSEPPIKRSMTHRPLNDPRLKAEGF
jgi:hypothetical protein